MAEKVITPFPPMPPLADYQHLSHKERMLAGYPYHNLCDELVQDRVAARKLIQRFNATLPEERPVRFAILKELLHPDSRENKVFIQPPFRVDYGYNIVAGNNVELNFGCGILDGAKVIIGDNCLMAPNVQIYTSYHPMNPKYRKDDEHYYEQCKPVTIGRNVWIGGQAVILPGVTIGDNSVIGANSVVNKDVAANVLVAGNPARFIRNINPGEQAAAARKMNS